MAANKGRIVHSVSLELRRAESEMKLKLIREAGSMVAFNLHHGQS